MSWRDISTAPDPGTVVCDVAEVEGVRAFDLSQAALAKAVEAGCAKAGTAAEAVDGADIIVSMLPAGAHVKAVYMNEGGVIDVAKKGALFIDSSTIDVDSARTVIKAATAKGFEMVDAPVSGGVAAATAGTLTFMVGGEEASTRKPSLRFPRRLPASAGR